MSLNVLWCSTTGADAAAQASKGEAKTASGLEPELALRVETDPDRALEHRGWYEVLVDGSPSPKLLDARGLKHVIVPFVGISDALRENLLARPRLKLYNSHFNDAFVAQHAVALLLAIANRIVPADRGLRGGDWTQGGSSTPESFFLEGKTALLLGYGAIGQALEGRLRGLGLGLSALRRNPRQDPGMRTYGPDELHQALAGADVVIASLPATPETRGMLDAAAFGAMRTGSILVNVGRGDVVEEAALFEALRSRKLFGAGLDVWWTYPKKGERERTLPSSLPFHDLDNVVMSPHRANEVQGWHEASFRDVAETLNAIARGESRNRVEPSRGY